MINSRAKGQAGELEVVKLLGQLTGLDVRRKVRQHANDSDIEGAPGWSIEVKRVRAASRADIRTWWAQAERQALAATASAPECDARLKPLLLYRANRDEWRAVWQPFARPYGYEHTVEAAPAEWAHAALRWDDFALSHQSLER